MNEKFFNETRVAFTLQNCHHCRKLLEFIERINMKMPIEKHIKVVDCTYFQNYGIINDPLIEIYSNHFSGFPTVFIGNIKIPGLNSRIEIEAYLNSLLFNDFIVDEYNEHRFNKDCSYNEKGRIICN